MTVRRKYLIQLKNKMLFYFTASAIAETLADINQIFDAAAEEGRTEEQVCRELGKPEEMTAQMIQEDSLKSSFSNSKLFSLLLAAGLVLGIGVLLNIGSYNPAFDVTREMPYLWALPALGIPAFLWHLSGSCCLYEFPQNVKAGRTVTLLAACITLPCAIAEQVCLSKLLDWDSIDRFQNLILATGKAAYAGIFIALVFGIFAAVRLFFGEYIYFPALLTVSGFWFTSMMYWGMISRLDAPLRAWLPSLLTAVPYVVCLLAACRTSLMYDPANLAWADVQKRRK